MNHIARDVGKAAIRHLKRAERAARRRRGEDRAAQRRQVELAIEAFEHAAQYCRSYLNQLDAFGPDKTEELLASAPASTGAPSASRVLPGADARSAPELLGPR